MRRKGTPFSGNDGLSLTEIAVAMAIGGFIMLGVLEALRYFNKSLTQSRQLGEYGTFKNYVTRTLDKMENCSESLQLGAPGLPAQLQETVPIGLVVPGNTPPRVVIDKDGKTMIDGVQYLLTLTLLDDTCYRKPVKNCIARVDLEMHRNRGSPVPGASMGAKLRFFGQEANSQPLKAIVFSTDHFDSDTGARNSFSSYKITGCTQVSPPLAGNVDYAKCTFPPADVAAEPTRGAPGAAITCAPKSLAITACAHKRIPSPRPFGQPVQDRLDVYCDQTVLPTNSTNNNASAIGCCALKKPMLTVRAPTWAPSCDPNKSEAVVGVCNNCGPNKKVYCQEVRDIDDNPISYFDPHFCRWIPQSTNGSLTSCPVGNLMFGYNDDPVRADQAVYCCPTARPD